MWSALRVCWVAYASLVPLSVPLSRTIYSDNHKHQQRIKSEFMGYQSTQKTHKDRR